MPFHYFHAAFFFARFVFDFSFFRDYVDFHAFATIFDFSRCLFDYFFMMSFFAMMMSPDFADCRHAFAFVACHH